jgi:hypothetical protein
MKFVLKTENFKDDRSLTNLEVLNITLMIYDDLIFI